MVCGMTAAAHARPLQAAAPGCIAAQEVLSVVGGERVLRQLGLPLPGGAQRYIHIPGAVLAADPKWKAGLQPPVHYMRTLRYTFPNGLPKPKPGATKHLVQLADGDEFELVSSRTASGAARAWLALSAAQSCDAWYAG